MADISFIKQMICMKKIANVKFKVLQTMLKFWQQN